MSGLPATYVSATSFSVAGDLTADFVSGVRVLADCGVDGTPLGTVTAASYAAPNTTVTVVLDSGALTANLTLAWHGNDIPASLCNHASQHMMGGRDAIDPEDIGAMPADRRVDTVAPLRGGGNLWGDLEFWVDDASTDGPGTVRLATPAEALAGTDAARVPPLSALRQAYRSWQRDDAGRFPGLILPAFNLFAPGLALPGTTTFSRASSGTFRGAAGIIKVATTNVPRFEYGPDGDLRGLLIEAAATNQALYSNMFEVTHRLALTSVSGTFAVGETVTGGTGSGVVVAYSAGTTAYLGLKTVSGTFSGTVTGGTSGATGTYSAIAAVHVHSNITVTPNAITGPDGAMNADKLCESSTSSVAHAWVSGASAITAGAVSAYQIKIKAGERTEGKFQVTNAAYSSGAYAVFNLSAGTVGGVSYLGTGSAGIASIKDAGDGFWLITLSCIVDASSATARASVTLYSSGAATYAGTVGYGVYISHLQIESGAIPTSYIETLESAVTRAADVCSVALSGIDFNAKEGAVFIKARTPRGRPTVAEVLFMIDDGSASNRIYINRGVTGAITFTVDVGGSTVASIGTTVIADDTDFTCVASWKADDFKLSVNGETPFTDSSGALPSGLVAMRPGQPSSAANMWQGPIKHLALIPRALTAAQAQAVAL
jgi:hypothetical protein